MAGKPADVFLNFDAQIPVGDGNGGNSDIFAHDDRAGALIDDHLGHRIRGDSQPFDHRYHGNGIASVFFRNFDFNGAGIQGTGNLFIKCDVDRLRHPGGSGKIRLCSVKVSNFF